MLGGGPGGCHTSSVLATRTFLIESGRPDEAAALYTERLVFWQRVKATWYLVQLETWADGLGIERVAR